MADDDHDGGREAAPRLSWGTMLCYANPDPERLSLSLS